MMSRSLRAEQVSVAFEGLRALSNVTLDIPPARVTGLIGPNGAGKTTLVNVLTGFQLPTSGRVMLDGVATSAMSAHQVRRRGVARTFQSARVFRDLSVLDNLAVTAAGAPSLIRSSEAVRHAYMGTQVDVEVADVEEAIL